MKHIRFVIATIAVIPLIVLMAIYLAVNATDYLHFSMPSILVSIYILCGWYFIPTPAGMIVLSAISAILVLAIIKRGKPLFQVILLALYSGVTVIFWLFVAWWYHTGQNKCLP